MLPSCGKWAIRAVSSPIHQHRPLDKLVLDLDSSVSETCGRQVDSAYNGYSACSCYRPLFCFNHLGDLDRVLLRNGNAASADHWQLLSKVLPMRLRSNRTLAYDLGSGAGWTIAFKVNSAVIAPRVKS